MFTEESDNVTSVDARDGWNTLTGTPIAERFDGRPVGILEGSVCNHNAGGLDMWRLEVFEETGFVTVTAGNTIIPDEWLRENQDLTTVRRIGHGLWIANEGSRKDGFAGDVLLGTERFAMIDRAILQTI